MTVVCTIDASVPAHTCAWWWCGAEITLSITALLVIFGLIFVVGYSEYLDWLGRRFK